MRLQIEGCRLKMGIADLKTAAGAVSNQIFNSIFSLQSEIFNFWSH